MLRPFKVNQDHRNWYQSTARMQFPISDEYIVTWVMFSVHRFRDIVTITSEIASFHLQEICSRKARVPGYPNLNFPRVPTFCGYSRIRKSLS